jgi:Cdc6-like AAA superfamily ATPase
MDQLMNKSNRQTVLGTLFYWSSMRGSSLILIGIANTMDLVTQVARTIELPKEPVVVDFKRYDWQQILKIIVHRLESVEDCTFPIFEATALQIIAKKVGVLGDLRKATEICT